MTTTIQQPTGEQDDFWTQDIALFDGVFRFYRNTPRPVRGKVHVSDERYYDKYDEIVPISVRAGKRTYVMLHPYVFEPKLTFTVALYHQPKQSADQDSAIGETVGAPKQDGVRQRQIGSAQAWYDPADKVIVLWEAFIGSFVGSRHPLGKNENMRHLWPSFERFLIQQVPQAIQIATPFHDPLAKTIEEYQAFLRTLGYEPVAQGAFGKPIRR